MTKDLLSRSSNVAHDSARGHVTGRSEYVDDRPLQRHELHVLIIGSPVAHGKLSGVDLSEVEKIPGVVATFTAKDFHHNRWGTIYQDQPLLVDETCLYLGEPVALVAVEDANLAFQVKRAARVSVQERDPVLSISEARKQCLFIGPERKLETGDPDAAMKKAKHRLKGVSHIAGQDHFYLESQASVVYPCDYGRLEVHSSSQHPTEVQHVIAHALGLPYQDVVCTVRRMGGGFGGKESQASPFAAYAALVAHRLRRPARIILTKDEDMQITGKRNPFEIEWEVGFDDEGRIQSLLANLFSDGGAYADLSTSIMERAMLHTDNAYFLPHARIRGQVCLTHTPPNTAFRGFGGPKGMIAMEHILEDIARTLSKDALDVRLANVYRSPKRNVTPYGQTIKGDMLPRLFQQLETTSTYRQRRREIDRENKTNSSVLRGLALTPVKFGISFTTRFLNQGNALVNVQTDGTIQVSTGATEMGQGVNTKIAQIVAGAFSIPVNHVRVMPTSTEKNQNTSPTAASSGVDINGAAALQACEQIKSRLQRLARELFQQKSRARGVLPYSLGAVEEIVLPTKEATSILFQDGQVFDSKKPKDKILFEDLVKEAWLNRISLSASGFFRYPGIHFHKEKGKGEPFYYFTNGVACSEVSIDRWTGELKVQAAHMLMDLGRPINPGIDLGQITGAFVQGMGWLTTERLVYNAKGQLLSHSPSTYKIPTIQDIPRVFKVDLLENDENLKNVLGSKAVGEPPLMLAISVWAAVKDALSTLNGKPVPLRVPATQEEILHWIPDSFP